MQTLTITDAKKNLGKLLRAAAQGQEVGIVSGADIIALRKVEVEAADHDAYALREYGVTRKDLERFDQAVDRHIARKERKGGFLRFNSAAELKEALEKAAGD